MHLHSCVDTVKTPKFRPSWNPLKINVNQCNKNENDQLVLLYVYVCGIDIVLKCICIKQTIYIKTYLWSYYGGGLIIKMVVMLGFYSMFQEKDARIIMTGMYEDRARALLCAVRFTYKVCYPSAKP